MAMSGKQVYLVVHSQSSGWRLRALPSVANHRITEEEEEDEPVGNLTIREHSQCPRKTVVPSCSMLSTSKRYT